LRRKTANDPANVCNLRKIHLLVKDFFGFFLIGDPFRSPPGLFVIVFIDYSHHSSSSVKRFVQRCRADGGNVDASNNDARRPSPPCLLMAFRQSMAEDSSLWHRHVHFFHENDRPVKQKFFDHYQRVVFKYEYSSNGRIDRLKSLSRDMAGIYRHPCGIRLFYDSSGKIIQLDEVFPDGSLWYRTELTYDAKGNAVEEKLFDSRGLNPFSVTQSDEPLFNDLRRIRPRRNQYGIQVHLGL